MERNPYKTAEYFKSVEAQLCAHVKVQKAMPIVCHKKLEAGGAVGVTCVKLVNAEVVAAAGIKDLLIANQIVGSRKIKTLVRLAAYSDMIVAVDNDRNVVEGLSRLRSKRGAPQGARRNEVGSWDYVIT